jgi:hypothetical protein
MNTLRMLTVGMLLAAAAATAATAAEEASVTTFTITAKRHATAPAAERVPPQADVAFTILRLTDMPEAEIDYHLTPIGAPPAPAVERATL